MPIAENTQLGQYKVLSLLGAGGMGEVYLAQDTKLDRKIALKILPVDIAADHGRMERFVREAKAAAALSHPNIAHIYQTGEANGVHFIAMEFIEGVTLREMIHRNSRNLKKLLRHLQHIAEALAKAHAAGIVHRDLKPENIMISRDGHAKILDFGLAKLIDQTRSLAPSGEAPDMEASTVALPPKVSTSGVIMGTVNYMSPEQAQGKPVDHRSDIFSFGCILYEVATGQRAFESGSTVDTLHKIVHGAAPRLNDANPSAPADLTRIVRRCLAKDPDERFQSIKEAAIELREVRRELEGAEGLEGPTSVGSTSSTATSSGATPSGGPGSTAGTSSASYIITGIKHHKLATVIVAALVLAGIGLTAYLRPWKTGVPIESIAVLPFVNQDNDPNTEYLADGIPESIMNSLSQLPHLKVMSRNSVFHYKGKETNAQAIAKELNVQAVVTGRVVQRGDNLAISVELINAQDNSELWGQQYNRKMADVFAVQQEIAQEISEKLRVKLSGAERQQLSKRPTQNLKAFQYYMQGRAYTSRRTRDDLLTAIRYSERAIEEDPNYTLAYVGLAEAYAALGVRGYIAPQEARQKAEETSRRALTLDENLAEAHAAVGYVETAFTPYNFSLGDRELRRAIELSPSLALAHQYLALSLDKQGRLDEALAEVLKARELDPLSSIIARQEALPYYLKRDYVRAMELLRQANELGPALNTTFEIGIYIESRSFDEALRALEQAKQERKDDSILVYATGVVNAAQGRRGDALEVIKELEQMSGSNLDQALYIAKVYATLNDKEMALSWLDRGFAAGAIGSFYKDEPVWDPIRSDPRFADLLRRMRIPS